MQGLNTLIVPTSIITTRKLILALILCTWGAGVSAGIQHYQASLDQTRWEASTKKLHCTLTHDIPFYGRATFAQTAGESLGFTIKVKRKATRNRDMAHLRILPPEWKHQEHAIDLDNVAVHKGDTPFQLEADISHRMLAELQKGMFPTFSYRDWADARDKVTVSLPGIHIKEALDTFIQCLADLPVYQFADFKDSLLLFASGKYDLSAAARKRLDDVIRYMKTDPEVKSIEVTGHTDSVGRKRNNDSLGTRRSEAVRGYLIANGVSPDKFKLSSNGERSPVDSNRTDQGRAKNRRATLTLSK